MKVMKTLWAAFLSLSLYLRGARVRSAECIVFIVALDELEGH